MLPANDGGWRRDYAQARRERRRIDSRKSFNVRRCGVATVGSVERPQVEIDRAVGPLGIAIPADNVRAQDSGQESRWKKSSDRRERACHSARDRRPVIESDAADESEMRDSRRELCRNQLRDAATHSVTHDTRTRDSELIEDLDDAFSVGLRVHSVSSRPIAPAVAEQVEDDEAVSGWNERNDLVPQMARRRKTVDEYCGYSGAPRSGGVVIQPGAGEVEKLTAHANP